MGAERHLVLQLRALVLETLGDLRGEIRPEQKPLHHALELVDAALDPVPEP